MNKKIKVLISFGTRPEGIKVAPVIKQIQKNTDKFELIVCSTGQHKEMLSQVIDFFELKPDIELNVMTQNQSLSMLSSKLIGSMEEVFQNTRPDIVLVQGDTTTAFLTAFIAFYQKIKVGHIEAGLRTYNKYSPFPEEINRQLVSRIADLHFAPTEEAYKNLVNEGIDKDIIFLTGNTVVDAINWGIDKINNKNTKNKNTNIVKNDLAQESEKEFEQKLNNKLEDKSENIPEVTKYSFEEKSNEKTEDIKYFESLIKSDRKVILVTMHRRESFGEDIKNVCEALKFLSQKYRDIDIVYPVHLNPNVSGPVNEILGNIENIKLVKPLSYEPFLWLMSKSYFIITDSGGVQEEAPTLKKPVLVIRKFTERAESLKLGISKLAGTDTQNIINNASLLLDSDEEYKKMVAEKNPYGDGRASERIVSAILKYFKNK
ncbi:MAG: UDP-N-acetylglucosamine 2-epimerase (non-hydrolyzing) [Actinobacteria bacterium]|nr:UDP-N-acetylglucosamine 2-epimerase (non-hydrolyzing) [Cyanobacteriota bacterium]MCL5770731.1 UDP-N-acetylglucosamine 2-epimerase (non-hydrolyzing) [Actinomycetota bacterium]